MFSFDYWKEPSVPEGVQTVDQLHTLRDKDFFGQDPVSRLRDAVLQAYEILRTQTNHPDRTAVPNLMDGKGIPLSVPARMASVDNVFWGNRQPPEDVIFGAMNTLFPARRPEDILETDDIQRCEKLIWDYVLANCRGQAPLYSVHFDPASNAVTLSRLENLGNLQTRSEIGPRYETADLYKTMGQIAGSALPKNPMNQGRTIIWERVGAPETKDKPIAPRLVHPKADHRILACPVLYSSPTLMAIVAPLHRRLEQAALLAA